METLILKPSEVFNFSTLFKMFEDKLYYRYPFRIRIFKQEGDLILSRPELKGKEQNITVDIHVKEFDEIFGSASYSFKSSKGCSLSYDLWQLGKKLT